MILVYPSQVQEQLNVRLVGWYEGNFRGQKNLSSKVWQIFSHGRLICPSAHLSLCPGVCLCLCEAGLLIIVLSFLCLMMPCKPCPGVDLAGGHSISCILAMYFSFCFPKTGQKGAVSQPWAFRVCSLKRTLWPGLSVVGRGQGNPGS